MITARIDAFIRNTGLPITRFCRKIELSPQCYYRWRKGEVNLKDSTIKRIEMFLEQFGF